MTNPYPSLRRVALLEGVSFVFLMGVAMPLKYVWDAPMAVKVSGWIHGVLFLWFALEWQRTRLMADWPAARSVKVFVAALLPFGPFVIDRSMRTWEQEYLRSRP
ncbi:MAG: DUF3817 domain-containing protein [Planctomycetota bacterium]